MKKTLPYIETPFNKRHQCWFCGEPSNQHFLFPGPEHVVINCSHPTLVVPSCVECCRFAEKSTASSIWQIEASVKRGLIQRYKKDLAIGINWSQQELIESEFDGGNFEGFKRSAWFVYEVAQARVNFKPWQIILNGIEIKDTLERDQFHFDGINYPCIDDALQHYAQTHFLQKSFLKEVTYILGVKNFAAAVRFCRLRIGYTPNEKQQAIKELIHLQK